MGFWTAWAFMIDQNEKQETERNYTTSDGMLSFHVLYVYIIKSDHWIHYEDEGASLMDISYGNKAQTQQCK